MAEPSNTGLLILLACLVALLVVAVLYLLIELGA